MAEYILTKKTIFLLVLWIGFAGGRLVAHDHLLGSEAYQTLLNSAQASGVIAIEASLSDDESSLSIHVNGIPSPDRSVEEVDEAAVEVGEKSYAININSHDVIFAWNRSEHYLALGERGRDGGDRVRLCAVAPVNVGVQGVSELDSLEMDGEALRALAWSNDGNYLVVVTDGLISIYTVEKDSACCGKLQVIISREHACLAHKIAWSSDDQYLALVADAELEVFAFGADAQTPLKLLDSFESHSKIKDFSWSERSSVLALLTEDKISLLYVSKSGIARSRTQQCFVSAAASILAWEAMHGSKQRLIASDNAGSYRMYTLDESGRFMCHTKPQNFLHGDEEQPLKGETKYSLVNKLYEPSRALFPAG
jgi:WD40 repeat protein